MEAPTVYIVMQCYDRDDLHNESILAAFLQKRNAERFVNRQTSHQFISYKLYSAMLKDKHENRHPNPHHL